MTSTARPYLPLLGFVLPTLAIGYGIVIPRSCIAGVNELSIGFGTTVLGAALTYVAGVRLASPSCSRPPLRRRVEQYINRQASHPHGIFGRLLGLIWRFEHRSVNQRTLDLLDLAPHHDVLEVGCGPGLALREAALRAAQGTVTGLDVSELMVATARRRNRDARVRVERVQGEDLGLGEAAFDRVYSVHSLYFWKQPEQVFAELARALRPGGRLVLAFRPEGNVPERFRDRIYRFYEPSQILEMVAPSGLILDAQHQQGDVTFLVFVKGTEPSAPGS